MNIPVHFRMFFERYVRGKCQWSFNEKSGTLSVSVDFNCGLEVDVSITVDAVEPFGPGDSKRLMDKLNKVAMNNLFDSITTLDTHKMLIHLDYLMDDFLEKA